VPWRNAIHLLSINKEGFDLFAAMMDGIKEEIAGFVFNIEVTVESANNQVVAPGLEAKQLPQAGLQYTAADESGVRTTGEVSRSSTMSMWIR